MDSQPSPKKNAFIEASGSFIMDAVVSDVAVARANLALNSRRMNAADIEREEGLISRYGKLADAYRDFCLAVNTPNPLHARLKERFTSGQSLTKEELTIFTSYILFRTMPTMGEINGHMARYLDVLDPASARIGFENLGDELGGSRKKNSDHIALLFKSLDRMKDALGRFDMLDRKSYVLANSMLRFRDEKGRLPTREEFENFSLTDRGTGHVLSTQNRIDKPMSPVRFMKMNENRPTWAHLGTTDDHITIRAKSYYDVVMRILTLIPENSAQYARKTYEASLRGAQYGGNTQELTASSLRLAVREASSAESDGIIAILQTVLKHYRPRFGQQKEFERVMAYVNAHIHETTGVEDKHQKEAIQVALQEMRKLYDIDPDKLAIVFRQEADLVRSRTKLAADFAEAMDGARKRNPNDEVSPRQAAVRRDSGAGWVTYALHCIAGAHR